MRKFHSASIIGQISAESPLCTLYCLKHYIKLQTVTGAFYKCKFRKAILQYVLRINNHRLPEYGSILFHKIILLLVSGFYPLVYTLSNSVQIKLLGSCIYNKTLA
jgi:hypothetical protein